MKALYFQFGASTDTSPTVQLNNNSLKDDCCSIHEIFLVRARELVKSFTQFLPPYVDVDNRIIRLFHTGTMGVRGLVTLQNGDVKFVPSNRILNPMGGSFQIFSSSFSPKSSPNWQLVFDASSTSITVWPKIRAAGDPKGEPSSSLAGREVKKTPIHFGDANNEAHVLDGKVKKLQRHFKDTPETRQRLAMFSSNRQTYVGEVNRRDGTPLIHDGQTKSAHYRECYRAGTYYITERYGSQTAKACYGYIDDPKLYKWIQDPHHPGRGRFDWVKNPNHKGDDPGGGGGGGSKPKDPPPEPDFPKRYLPTEVPKKHLAPGEICPGLDSHSFENMTQKNGLEKEFNAQHPDNPMSSFGGKGGSIGGVGNQVGIIENLFSKSSDWLEREHCFYIPTSNAQLPCSTEKLQQLSREIFAGIYAHDAVPFFSLHFNERRDMYPVIHPVFQNTLVGQVISLLDYYMKGFLNGGYFDQETIATWHSIDDAQQKADFLNDRLINVSKLVNDSGLEGGFSVKAIIQGLELRDANNSDQPIIEENPIFSDYSGCRNSFRIIAKQNSFKKTENLFTLDGDFDVLYTIELNPQYLEELHKFRQVHGADPKAYSRLIEAYEMMCGQIKEVMPQIPQFTELFQLLKLTNFLCYYFKTLKLANKAPSIPDQEIESSAPAHCPPSFPSLPIWQVKNDNFVELNEKTLYRALGEVKGDIVSFLEQAHENTVVTASLIDRVSAKLITFFNSRRSYVIDKFEEKVQKFTVGQLNEYLNTIKKYLSDPEFLKRDQKSREIEEAKNEIEVLRGQHDVAKRNNQLWSTLNAPSTNAGFGAFNMFPQVDLNKAFATDRANAAERAFHAKEMELNAQMETNDPLNPSPSLWKLALGKKFTWKEAFVSLEANAANDLIGHQARSDRSIVGGCGIDLTNREISSDMRTRSLFEHNAPKFLGATYASWHSLENAQGTGIQGHFFKLPIFDFFSSSNEKNNWLRRSLNLENSDAVIRRVMSAISSNDFDEFENASRTVSDWSERTGDKVGVAHVAAMAADLRYLQALVDAGCPLDMQDHMGFSPLHFAARKGKIANVDFLLNNCPSLLNLTSLDGTTPLIHAVQHSQLPVVQNLIERENIDINLRTTFDMSALYCAIHNQSEDIALALLESEKIDVCQQTDDQTTVLYLACELNSANIVARIIAKGADVNLVRWDGYAPLHIAVERSNIHSVQHLLNSPDLKIDAPLKSGKTALHLAAQEDSRDALIWLIEKGAKIDPLGWNRETPLIVAVASGSFACAEELLSRFGTTEVTTHDGSRCRFVDAPNRLGQTPSDIAAELKYKDLQELILESALQGMQFSQKQLERLCVQLCRGHCSVGRIEELIDGHSQLLTASSYAQIVEAAVQFAHIPALIVLMHRANREQFIPLDRSKYAHLGAKVGNTQLIRTAGGFREPLFVKGGIATSAVHYHQNATLRALIDEDPYLSASDLKHLLWEGVSVGNVDACRLLLNHPQAQKLDTKNPQIGSGEGHINDAQVIWPEYRLSHLAAEVGSIALMKLLTQRQAQLDTKQVGTGYQCWHFAIKNEQLSILEFLFEKNLKLPKFILCFAAAHGKRLSLQKILQHPSASALVNVEAKDGETPLLAAIQNHQSKCVELLYSKGADILRISSNASEMFPEGTTPLRRAATGGRGNILRYILNCPEALEISQEERSLIKTIAMQSQDRDTIHALLERDWEIELNHFFEIDGEVLFTEQLKQTLWDLPAYLGDQVRKEEVKRVFFALQKGEFENFFALSEKLDKVRSLSLFDIQPLQFRPLLQVAFLNYGQFANSNDSDLVEKEEFLKNCIAKWGSASFHARDVEGNALLHLIAKSGEDFNVVDVLGTSDVDWSIKNSEGQTPLHLCVHSKNLRFMQRILCMESGVKVVNAPDSRGQSPLALAIATKEFACVRELLSKQADPNHSVRGLTPLMLAAQLGSQESIHALLTAGANVDLSSPRDGNTALLIAIYSEHFDTASELIKCGANADRANLQGVCPAHLAANKGAISLLRSLWACGAKLDTVDNQGNNIAHFAASSTSRESREVFLCLREWGIDLNRPRDFGHLDLYESPEDRQGLAPVHLAAFKGNVPAVDTLIKFQVPVDVCDDQGNGLLYFSGASGNKELLNYLAELVIIQDKEQLQRGIKGAIEFDRVEALRFFHEMHSALEFSISGVSPLQLACQCNAIRCANYLVDCEVDVQFRDANTQRSALDVCVDNHRHAQARMLLLRTNVDPNVLLNGSAPLHRACKSGDLAMVEVLLEFGALVDLNDSEDRSPLHFAVQSGNVKLLELLVLFGGDLNELDWRSLSKPMKEKVEDLHHQLLHDEFFVGGNGLHFAATHDKGDYVQLLALRGQSADQRNAKKMTPLHVAATHGAVEVTRRLMEWVEDVDVVDGEGRTSLYLAATTSKSPKLVDLLLSAGASLSVDHVGDNLLEAISRQPFCQNAQRIFTTIRRAILSANKSAPWRAMGEDTLSAAISRGDQSKVLRFAQEGNADLAKESLLAVAAQNGQNEMVELLANWFGLSVVESAGTAKNNPLLWALRQNNGSLIEFLEKRGAKITAAHLIDLYDSDNGELKNGELFAAAHDYCVAKARQSSTFDRSQLDQLNSSEEMSVASACGAIACGFSLREQIENTTCFELFLKRQQWPLINLLIWSQVWRSSNKGIDHPYHVALRCQKDGQIEVVHRVLRYFSKCGAEVGTSEFSFDEQFAQAMREGNEEAFFDLFTKRNCLEPLNELGTGLLKLAESHRSPMAQYLRLFDPDLEVQPHVLDGEYNVVNVKSEESNSDVESDDENVK